MQLSKQHKIYGAVLGLALAAFGADRFFSSPAQAADATASYAVESTAADKPATAGTRVGAPVMVTAGANEVTTDGRRAISVRLEELAQTAGLKVDAVRDAFVPPVEWVGRPATVAVAPVVNHEDERARRFVAEHRLTAVMGGKNVVAIVDGKPLRPGQTLDGFKLVSVSARDVKATFERAGSAPVELRLKEVAGAVAQAH